jgi:hypothetical protein
MSPLRIIGPASMEVWISSPVRSRKPVLMKQHACFGGADALLEVDRRAALLVHDAHLQGVGRQAQRVLDAVNSSTAKATSSGPCIFGLTI